MAGFTPIIETYPCMPSSPDGRLIVFGLFIWLIVVLIWVFRKKFNRVLFWILIVGFAVFAAFNTYERVPVWPDGDTCGAVGMRYVYTETGHFTYLPNWMDEWFRWNGSGINLP